MRHSLSCSGLIPMVSLANDVECRLVVAPRKGWYQLSPKDTTLTRFPVTRRAQMEMNRSPWGPHGQARAEARICYNTKAVFCTQEHAEAGVIVAVVGGASRESGAALLIGPSCGRRGVS